MELSGERSFISGASLNISAIWNGPASEICRTYWLKSQKGSLGAGWVPRQRTSLRNSELINSHKRHLICTWIYGGVKFLPKDLIYLWRLTWWSTRSSRTFPAVSTLMSEWTQKMCLRSGSALASEGYLTDFTLLHSHKWKLRCLWIVASLRACERATFYSVHLNDTSKRPSALQVCRAEACLIAAPLRLCFHVTFLFLPQEESTLQRFWCSVTTASYAGRKACEWGS